MPNFLESSFLPGEPIPKHEHKKLTVILVIVVVIALAILASLLYVSKNPFKYVSTDVNVLSNLAPSPTMDPVAAELRRNEVKVSEEQKTKIAEELLLNTEKVSEKEKADMLAEILKYSNK